MNVCVIDLCVCLVYYKKSTKFQDGCPPQFTPTIKINWNSQFIYKITWRDSFTTPTTCQVSIWSVFSVINITFIAKLFFKSGQIGKILLKTDLCFISWTCKELVKCISNVIYVLMCTQLAQGAFWDTKDGFEMDYLFKITPFLYFLQTKCQCLSALMWL